MSSVPETSVSSTKRSRSPEPQTASPDK